jgi:putative peptidoglycan lipid II flippase
VGLEGDRPEGPKGLRSVGTDPGALEAIKPHLRPVSAGKNVGTGRHVAVATVIVGASTLLSTILGFAREIVNARFYGAQWEMDTFLAAATIPTILFGVFQGALMSALVPLFSSYLAKDDREDAWRLASTILNALLIFAGIAALLGWVFAPWYVPLIAHGFPAPQMTVAIRMTRWLIFTLVATSLAGAISAILNATHHFRAAALQGIAINVVTIACVVWLNGRFGIYALVLGTALGLTAQLIVQLPSFFRLRGYRLVMQLDHPGLRELYRLLGPIMIGSTAGQIAMLLDRYFASMLSPGYMSGMNYAIKLVYFPQQVFAVAIATVIFPVAALQFASKNQAGLRYSISIGLRLVTLITIPATCGLIVLGKLVIETLFQRGAFGPAATALTADLIPYAAVGLVALAANVLLTRFCFACNESRRPVVIALASVALNAGLSLLWLPTLGARGLLLANSLSQGLQAVLLTCLVAKLMRGIDWMAIAQSVGRVIGASAAMTLVINYIYQIGSTTASTFLARAELLAVDVFVGIAIFFAVAHYLGVTEIGVVVQLLFEKLRRGPNSPVPEREAPIA